MNINANIIKSLLNNNFKREIENTVKEDLHDVDSEDLGLIDVDSVEFLSIENSIILDDYEVDQDDDSFIISGTLILEVEINGLEDGMSVGTDTIPMVYTYSFTKQDKEVYDLYLEWVD